MVPPNAVDAETREPRQPSDPVRDALRKNMRIIGSILGILILAAIVYGIYRVVVPGGPTAGSVAAGAQARAAAPAPPPPLPPPAPALVAQPAAAQAVAAVPSFCGPAPWTDHPPSSGRGYSVDTRGRAGAIADVWYQGSAVPRELSIRVPAGVVVDFPGANGKVWNFPNGCSESDVDSHQAAHASERAEIRGVLTLEQAVEQRLAAVRQ